MIKHTNLTAYDEYENLKTREEILAYREDKLKSAQLFSDFIRRYVGHRQTFLELGSGNSKSLYSLYNNNLLSTGIGLEISKRRFHYH